MAGFKSSVASAQPESNPGSYSPEYNYTIEGAWIAFLLNKEGDEQLKRLLKNQSVDNARKICKNFDSLIEEFETELN